MGELFLFLFKKKKQLFKCVQNTASWEKYSYFYFMKKKINSYLDPQVEINAHIKFT